MRQDVPASDGAALSARPRISTQNLAAAVVAGTAGGIGALGFLAAPATASPVYTYFYIGCRPPSWSHGQNRSPQSVSTWITAVGGCGNGLDGWASASEWNRETGSVISHTGQVHGGAGTAMVPVHGIKTRESTSLLPKPTNAVSHYVDAGSGRYP
jgi:hypothetical protein